MKNQPCYLNDDGGDVRAISLTAYARAEDRVWALCSGFQMHIAQAVESVEAIVALVISPPDERKISIEKKTRKFAVYQFTIPGRRKKFSKKK